MFDAKTIRDDPAAFDAGRAKRGLAPLADEIIRLDGAVRAAKSTLQAIQEQRNTVSKEIGAAKSRGEDAADLIAEVATLKDDNRRAEDEEREAGAALNVLLAGEPNLPEDAVPSGTDESANVEQHRWGEPRDFNFAPKEHFDIGEGLGLMDFETAARMSGARFVVLKGALARLERALAQLMLDMHTTESGYTEVNPPLLVREQAAFGTGNLPKFAEDLFRTTDDYYLIPTAEMPLTNLVADQIVDQATLPRRYTAFTPCFSLRGRGRGQGHPGHDPRPPVLQGRTGQHRPSRRVRR